MYHNKDDGMEALLASVVLGSDFDYTGWQPGHASWTVQIQFSTLLYRVLSLRFVPLRFLDGSIDPSLTMGLQQAAVKDLRDDSTATRIWLGLHART